MKIEINKIRMLLGLFLAFIFALGSAPGEGLASSQDGIEEGPGTVIGIQSLGVVGQLDTPASAEEVVAAGDFAYIADGTSLRIADISNPTAPVEVGFINLLNGYYSGCISVAVAGNYAYCAGFQKLYVVNISNPAAPILVGQNTGYIWGSPMGLEVAGNYVYFLENHDTGSGYLYRLWIFDVSNPASPAMKGIFSFAEEATDVAMAGNYAFIANEGAGLHVLDVSNPSLPVQVGSYDPPVWVGSVSVLGSYAYVGVCSGLRIVNISNLTAPVEVGSITTSSCSLNVAVASGYAYVGESGTIRMFDVSNPAFPGPAGSYSIAGYTNGGVDVAVADGYVYVAAGNVGLVILRVSTTFKVYLPMVLK